MSEKIVRIRLEDFPEEFRKSLEDKKILDNHERLRKSFQDMTKKAEEEWQMGDEADMEGT